MMTKLWVGAEEDDRLPYLKSPPLKTICERNVCDQIVKENVGDTNVVKQNTLDKGKRIIIQDETVLTNKRKGVSMGSGVVIREAVKGRACALGLRADKDNVNKSKSRVSSNV